MVALELLVPATELDLTKLEVLELALAAFSDLPKSNLADEPGLLRPLADELAFPRLPPDDDLEKSELFEAELSDSPMKKLYLYHNEIA